MTWNPQTEGLQQLCNLLQNLTVADTALQRTTYYQIHELRKHADFILYLSHIFARAPELSAITRHSAGAVLRSHVAFVNAAHIHNIDFVKECCIVALVDELRPVRHTAGSIIATMMAKIGYQGWPDIFDRLSTSLNASSGDHQKIESILSCLGKICEDITEDITHERERPLEPLLPKIMELLHCESREVALAALDCVNKAFRVDEKGIQPHINDFLAYVFQLASTEDSEVRSIVCDSLARLMEHHLGLILPNMDSVMEFILKCAQEDQDDAVQKASCNFLYSYALNLDRPQHYESFHKYIGHVLPVVLRQMAYSDDEIAQLEEEEGDLKAAPADLAPPKPRAKGEGNGMPDGTDTDVDDEYESGKGGGYNLMMGPSDDRYWSTWTARKAAAACLDQMSQIYRDAILDALLPALKEALFHHDWLRREAGILTLGAIARGCQGIRPHLPDLVPYLLESLRAEETLVRVITCWTLQRYNYWIVEQEDHTRYFEPLLEGLLDNVLDKNTALQRAACCSLTEFAIEAGHLLTPYLEPIATNLGRALAFYPRRNLTALYRAVGYISEAVGESFNKEPVVAALLPTLMRKVAKCVKVPGPNDDDAYTLFECICYITNSIGRSILPYAKESFATAFEVAQGVLLGLKAYDEGTLHYEPNKGMILVTFDYMASVCHVLVEDAAPLVQAVQEPLFDMLLLCMEDELFEARQSAFWLLGDLAISSFDSVKGALPRIMPLCAKNLVISHEMTILRVTHNVLWALGEIAARYPAADIDSHLSQMVVPAIELLKNPEMMINVRDTASQTLGKIAYTHPSVLAHLLPTFAKEWCVLLRVEASFEERQSATAGICRLVLSNPEGLKEALADFVLLVCAFEPLPTELATDIATIFRGYQELLGGETEFFNLLDGQLQERIVNVVDVHNRLQQLLHHENASR